MSSDLIDQLAEYGDHVRAAERPIELADVMGGTRDRLEITMLESADQRSRERNWWLIGSVAAAVLAVVVTGLVLLGDEEDGSGDELATGDSGAAVTSPESLSPDEATSPGTVPIEPPGAKAPVVPADALEEPLLDVTGPTGDTPLPDFENLVAGDDGAPRRPLGEVDEVPNNNRLDFLSEFCAPFLDGRCVRDAVFKDVTGREVAGEAGGPFHVRHGFVNEGDPLPEALDLAVYVFPLPLDDFSEDRAPIGPTQRYTTDYVVRGETDACGPEYESQTGTVTCEWFVHDFPNGLPEGRWALWAVWEAPCSTWIEVDRTDICTDPDEVMSFFSSGVDSPFEVTAPTAADQQAGPIVTEVGEWTRIDGLGLSEVVSDGSTFFATTMDTNQLMRSDDGVSWATVVDAPSLQLNSAWPKSVAIRDGRLVVVEDGQTSVTVHIVDPDGTVTVQDVPFDIPAQYLPFHRFLEPSVNILADGRIVVTASYSALVDLVALAAVGVPFEALPTASSIRDEELSPCEDCDFVSELAAEYFDVPLESIDDGPTHVDTDVVSVVIDGVEQDYTFDFGLDPLWNLPRALVVVSADGETWTQIDGPTDRFLQQVLPARGGLVADTGALVFGVEPGLATSVDGAEWSAVRHPDTGEPLRSGQLGSTANRTFVTERDVLGRRIAIWEITIDGAELIADSSTTPELRELGEGFAVGTLTAGETGLAFLTAVEGGFDEPLSELAIRWSRDGSIWTLEPFPEPSIGWGTLTLGSTTLLLTTWDSEGTSLWVREFPG